MPPPPACPLPVASLHAACHAPPSSRSPPAPTPALPHTHNPHYQVNGDLKKFGHINRKALDQYVNFTEQRDTLYRRKEVGARPGCCAACAVQPRGQAAVGIVPPSPMPCPGRPALVSTPPTRPPRRAHERRTTTAATTRSGS